MPRTVAVAMGMTVHDYLAYADARPDQRFELLAGEPVAMSPATRHHQVICGNLDRTLSPRVNARGCEVLRDFGFARSSEADFMPQPDVMVRCGPLAGEERWATDPVVLFEVLSPSTMSKDRGYKRQRYLEIGTLRHLVYVWQREMRVEVWSREGDGEWPTTPVALLEPDATLALTALGAALQLAEIYRGVTF